PTTPGTKLYWRLYHRGRQGEDTMALDIGAPGAATTPVRKRPHGHELPRTSTFRIPHRLCAAPRSPRGALSREWRRRAPPEPPAGRSAQP
ncbi:hypothetical protein EAO76_18495, partial [Streptomyces sp. sk2.1]